MAVHGYIHIPGLSWKAHRFDVPLIHSQLGGERLSIFAREVVAPGKEESDLPWLVFLQGGPGFGAPRPGGASGWIKRAIKDYRVLLLDQRGTGLSTPVLDETIMPIGTPQQQADYLKNFRADNIVRDAELIRKQLIGDKPWTVLGQSFGGFCLTTYLSQAPEGLAAAILTGGFAPLVDDPDEVYRRTYKRIIDKNGEYYSRYPDDAVVVRRIVDHLHANDVRMPDGERLTARRFLQIGIEFGMSGGYEAVHYLLELAFATPSAGIGLKFIQQFSPMLQFEANPIYALLHESIYCQHRASNWSADRLLPEFFEAFRMDSACPLFTGEMIYSWMFDEYKHLRGLKEASEILASTTDWPDLYSKSVLGCNTVPTVGTIYFDDMYVDLDLSLETARHIKGAKTWITNEYEHNGIREDGERVLDRLLSMLNGQC